jgi:RNA polymerase sigma factor (sigma-70 family)
MSELMAEKRESRISSVFNEYGNKLFRFIRGRVPTNADAEDISQEVWYQLSRVIELESIEQVSSWLYRVARNRITDSYRKRKTGLLEDEALQNDNGEINYKEILLAEAVSPEEEDLKQLFWEELFNALDELPEKQRDVFIWNELEDQTFQEIADRTGENIKTLISRKGYAVKYLRTRLQALYEEFIY